MTHAYAFNQAITSKVQESITNQSFLVQFRVLSSSVRYQLGVLCLDNYKQTLTSTLRCIIFDLNYERDSV